MSFIHRARRLSVLAVVVMMLSFGVAACGAANQPGTADADSSGGTGDAGGAFPVTVEHEYGTLTVPEKPERVVSLGFKYQDLLYALGVDPVAVRYWYGIYPHEINPWTKPHVDGAPPVVLKEINYEKIASLRPDLIVAAYSGITAEQHEKLSQIAPTLAAPPGNVDYLAPRRDVWRQVGTALGKAEETARLIAEVDALFEKAKQEYPELVGAEVAAAAAWSSDTVGLYASGDPRSQFLMRLGLEIPGKIDENTDEFTYNVSPELVAETFDYADDGVVILGSPLGGGQPGAHKALPKTTFSSSRVVAEGRVVMLDTTVTDVAFAFSSPLSIRFTLSHLVPQLAAAVDGDPATEVPPSPKSFDAECGWCWQPAD